MSARGDLCAGRCDVAVTQADVIRADRVARAVKRWTADLTDLSGRNTLLYYRDLRVGTLDLGGAEPTASERLFAAKPVRLSKLFPEPDQFANARKRTLAIYKKMRELEEERGIRAGYLVVGMARWSEERKTPQAPVLLRELSLTVVTARHDDFTVELDEETIVNPVLLHKLNRDFSLAIAPESFAEKHTFGDRFDPDPVFDRLRKLVHDVPAFTIEQRMVLGTFTYAKLPMVQDLEAAGQTLVTNDVVAAIAGDPTAQDAVAQEAAGGSGLDSVPPHDEFIVLDADSSQSRAINAILAGQNLVIQGPPGTGKSQTIANLIASLVADGRRVLFVAEKRAAIDAVLRRLEPRELTGLVLDVHDGAKNRRGIAEELGATLDRARVTPAPDIVTVERQVSTNRGRLVEHVQALHESRQPWGVTVFAAQAKLMEVLPQRRTSARLLGGELAALHGEVLDQVSEDLREYANLGGFVMTPRATPWFGAAIYSQEQAREAATRATVLNAQVFPMARSRLGAVLAGLGIRAPATAIEWGEYVRLLAGIQGTLASLRPEVYDGPVGDWAAATGTRRERRSRGASLSWEQRRRLRKAARLVWIGRKPRRRDLHQALVAAEEQRGRWADLCSLPASPSLPSGLTELTAAYKAFEDELQGLDVLLPAVRLAQQPLSELEVILSRLAGDTITPWRLPRLYELGQRLAKQGLSPLLAELTDRHASSDVAAEGLSYTWHASIIDQVRTRDPRYAAFHGDTLREAVRAFWAADHEHIRTNPARVRRRAAEGLRDAQDQHPEQARLIRAQATRKRKHLHLRDLVRQAPEVLLAAKPCWAVSPLIVSQVLPVQRLFDVVIFDEASQVPQADAIPSIMRARQVVVAGDTHQLPPTDFFAGVSAMADDDDEDDASQDGELVVPLTSGYESILATLAPLLPNSSLTWHYRSRDERLIAFSNAYIYHTLTSFPGVFGRDCLRHVPVDQHLGVAGQEHSVTAEVDTVVELVIEHARVRPTESLGVITMGLRHANRIDAKLRSALAEHADLEPFFDENDGEEPFFVKNLERVQGDERDAIILSIGYGKAPDGRMRYSWGPLNQDGGERRLNVAVTRAKHRVTLVSSFDSHDVDPSRVTREGGKLMCAYLKYAASGGENLDDVGPAELDLNPFEIAVRDRLREAGVPVIPQYGVAKYRIDFAAQHPEQPGRMVLAIEADGASYHSAEAARDRDRLREEHLRRLGWQFHRLWSTDWFLDPDAEVAKLRSAYEQAVTAADKSQATSTPLPKAAPEAHSAGDSTTHRSQPRPRVRSGLPIGEYSPRDLNQMVRWIESDGFLRTEDQLVSEVMAELGFQRRGGRIVEAIVGAIKATRSRPSS